MVLVGQPEKVDYYQERCGKKFIPGPIKANVIYNNFNL